MRTVGIDIGTTTISAVVMDAENKNVVRSKTVSNGSFIGTGREWERIQDPAVILEKARAVLDELLEAYPDAVAIGLTGQMHGILYLDEKGKGVSPLYTWQDGRGNLTEFHGKSLVRSVYEECGVKASAGYGLITHLYHIRKKLVPKGAVSMCTIGDYFGMVLTGRRKPLIHISNAASLGFFECARGKFMEETLTALGVDVSILPEVTNEISVLGAYKDIPVYAAIGDNQASFFGSVGLEKDTLLLNMGTGGQISVLSDYFFEVPGIEARPLTKDRYLLVGSSLCGGRAYAILERFFRSYVRAAEGKEVQQYGVMEKLAEKGALRPNRMQVETTFGGTRVDPDQRGSISNIQEDNFTPEGIVYGVLEGMARELYGMYHFIQNGTGIRASHLVASGNGLRKNRVLRQICSQMFDAELTLAPYEEEAACGAALVSVMDA